jgi:hypothetical protein
VSSSGRSEGPDTEREPARKPDGALRLDLERDLPTTPEDVAVLRRLRNQPVTPAQYAELLRAMGDASYEELARRPGPRGEPFEL